ncbi:MAG: tetratricopeptide repeat protein [Crocinitomicaceae bacterium]|nr:tetratricopeptide repeat protein [Crocinitomicaceae bacterium]MCF8433393.1 tetratricopeptide repeat protein [Crocinitomicaceae bacterium]
MNRFLVFVFIVISFVGISQTTEKYNSDYENFYRAEELFQKEQFGAARKEFRYFMDGFNYPNDPLFIKAAYYEGVSALELFNNDAVTLLENFIRNYPESIYSEGIYFRLGRYFYQKKNYSEALAYFNKLKASDVEADDQEEFYFKVGYSNFEEGKMPEARSAFYEIKDGTSQYAAPALYYYSHIAYTDGSYQTALEGFLKLQSDERFAKAVPYYIAQIYHKQRNYQAVVDYTPMLMDSIAPANQSDLNHIIGDAYYQLNKFDESVPYLEAYNLKSKTTREDDYQLGFAYYRSEQYENAIKLFDKVTRDNDKLAQYAFYHIGECYMKSQSLLPARSAFKAASEISGDSKIEEDALYHFAELSYKLDLNPYDEAVLAMELFLQKYPNSIRKNDVYQYLVNVYTTTNNYVKALESLDKLPNKDAKLKTAYQLVAFNHGVELYQKAKYPEAIAAFDLVKKYPIDGVILGKATFWTADAHFQLKNYDKSIKFYKEFIALPATNAAELKNEAYYNIGYAYLLKEDLSQAQESFRIYTLAPNKNKRKLADAFMRVADGHYQLKQDDQAIKNYLEVIKLKSGYEDQAIFYAAKSYGYSGKTDLKITQLLDLINNYTSSKYTMTALYELAKTYKSKNDYDKAYRYFTQVITDYPTVVLVTNCRIEIADIYFKRGEYAKSEAAYLSLLDEHGAEREVCETCARGLIDLYKAQKQPEKATSLASKYPCANFGNDEAEDLYYSPAIDAYVDSLFSVAIPNFEKYLEKFPTGKYAVESQVFLGNSYYRTGNLEKAIEVYRTSLDGPNNMYTEFCASRVSQHLYNNGTYDQALIYYERLEKTSSKPATLFNAKLGMMRCHFLLENWTSAAVYAKDVLSSSQINNTLRLEAEYAKGMSNYYAENYTDAKPSLEWLVKNTTTVMGSEAKFSLAEMYYKLKDYSKSDAEIKALLKMKPTYNYWVARGLILQSRILIVKEDLFQAEQTLKSVIDHYPDQNDGVISEANELWDELMQLKDKPKDVNKSTETFIELNENGGN